MVRAGGVYSFDGRPRRWGDMPEMDGKLLNVLTDRVIAHRSHRLSPAERAEVARIARGLACKDAARVAGLSLETVRTLRKVIYRKLRLAGSHELLSTLLQLALAMLASSE